MTKEIEEIFNIIRDENILKIEQEIKLNDYIEQLEKENQELELKAKALDLLNKDIFLERANTTYYLTCYINKTITKEEYDIISKALESVK